MLARATFVTMVSVTIFAPESRTSKIELGPVNVENKKILNQITLTLIEPSVVDPNTLDPNLGFLSSLDADPIPGLCLNFETNEKIISQTKYSLKINFFYIKLKVRK